ncbi:hypothetical protein B0A53_04045 [Rhodotorula sp. CCFEE 5036]|nr:hypothetical protein B0A53_04045 [Rhodotorula sp. CCFEE 5036]
MLQELEAVQRGLNESAAKAAPKPKFAFKRSAAHPLPASDNATPPPPPPPPASTRPAAAHASGGGGGAPADALTLANQSRAHLSRADLPNRRTSLTDSKTPRDNSDSQCLALIALSECVVDLLEPTATEGEDGSGTRSALTSTTSSSSYAAIYLSDLRDSLVLLPENARQGSVLVQNCSRCVFVLGGHQIRIHDSEDCSFFLAAGSQPIIERCRELVFGPYPSSLLLESNSLTNRFDAVQDFDDPFATSSRPSQNWRLATEADRASLDEALARYFSTV